MSEASIAKGKRSRRYMIIKLFIGLLFANSVYLLIGIAVFPKSIEPFSAYFLTTNGAILAVIGTWIGFISHKKKDE